MNADPPTRPNGSIDDQRNKISEYTIACLLQAKKWFYDSSFRNKWDDPEQIGSCSVVLRLQYKFVIIFRTPFLIK